MIIKRGKHLLMGVSVFLLDFVLAAENSSLKFSGFRDLMNSPGESLFGSGAGF